MQRRRWLIISGAPWGATAGGQRYEQLTKALLLLGEEVYFHCPWKNFPPSPYEPPTDLTYDIIIAGFPLTDIHNLPYHARLHIYDVCDLWEFGMIEGHSFEEGHAATCRWAHAIVAVSPFLASYLHLQLPQHPIFTIPNGLRIDHPRVLPHKIQSPAVLFWGSWYTGQSWWDFEAIATLAHHLRGKGIRFLIWGATDRPFPAQLPTYVEIETRLMGVAYSDIVQKVTRPFVGLIPYKQNCQVALAADPIKLYEYLALGGAPLVTNNCAHLHNERCIIGLGDAKQLLLSLIDEAIERASNLGRPQYVPTFRERAQQYVRVVNMLLSQKGW